jgi:hypothetical protein
VGFVELKEVNNSWCRIFDALCGCHNDAFFASLSSLLTAIAMVYKEEFWHLS